MARLQPGYNATLLARRDITPRLAIFEVAPDDPQIRFVPGQYTVLGLRRDAPRIPEAVPEAPDGDPAQLIRRPYSICSAAHEPERLEFYVSLLASGQLTPRLWALRPGDRLYVGPQGRGMLTLEQVPETADVLLVATGTGLGPYVSMLRSHAERFPARRIGVIHGARHAWDLGYRAELETYARRFPNLRYLPLVSRPEEDPHWAGPTGRVQQWLEAADFEARLGFPLDPERTHVFLCGNPDMVQDCLERLAARGFREATHRREGNLHAEKYW
ncbi:ferredoxin--NADP reductase [Inmirania thermothiophila]|uniref:ferredoxin--NADP(+) reductase n=1 Tax=Inmirania thermothiophila TaxID=1750597 RepID=A0A3N1Y1H0_9GAMM|nr:ferredoxin--NADP reductase [Inmirania thermothiophila]ROR32683.1 ferredoxin--NADP+ reductase [Inmirania thermothiophila]